MTKALTCQYEHDLKTSAAQNVTLVMSPKATPASIVTMGGIQKSTHKRTICWVKTISFYKSAFIFVQSICIVPHTPNSVCKNTHRKQETYP